MRNLYRKILSVLLMFFTAFSVIVNPLLAIAAVPDITEWFFSYEEIGNSYEEWTCPESGIYRFEVWGASGGGADGSNKHWNGSYESITLKCFKDEKYYVYCGQHGEYDNVSVNPRTYGGGGAGIKDKFGNYNGSGGGATSIRSKGGAIGSTYSYQIVTAGGGGGRNSIDSKWTEYVEDHNYGSGNGANSTYIWTPQDKEGKIYQNTYRLSPPEGGGYGGYTGSLTDNNPGSQRILPVPYARNGSSYIDTGLALDYAEKMLEHYGHGKARISFIDIISSNLIFDSNGGNIVTDDITTYEYGTEVVLPEAAKPGFIFLYWTDETSITKDIYYAGDTITIHDEDIILMANYIEDGTPSFYAKINENENTTNETEYYLHVNNIEDGKAKYIKLFVSEDGGNTFTEINESGYRQETSDFLHDFTYTGAIEEYRVLNTGYYKISAWGANGGKSFSNQTPGTQNGLKGDFAQGTAFLKRGETLYVTVGKGGTNASWANSTANYGAAFGGGGAASRQKNAASYGDWHGAGGGGGGATTFALGSTLASRILVAGGGGGAPTWSETYEAGGTSRIYSWTGTRGIFLNNNKLRGGQSAEVGIRSWGEKNNMNLDRRITGGGGGGWHGGYSHSNGTSGAMASRVSNVITSSPVKDFEWSNGTGTVVRDNTVEGMTPYNYNTSYPHAALTAATANGKASLEYLGSNVNLEYLDADFPIYPYDKLSPDPVLNVSFNSNADGNIDVNWEQVRDNGDVYVYKAQLYDKEDDSMLYECEDADSPGNTTINMDSTSGTKGYYYYVDNDPAAIQMKDIIEPLVSLGQISTGDKIITNKQVNYTEGLQRIASVPNPTGLTYIHIMPIDYAGNAGETTTFEIKPVSTINYYGNSADSGNITKQVSTGNDLIIKDNSDNPELYDMAYAKDGYSFVGWNTREDGSGTSYSHEDIITYDFIYDNFSGSLNLYAQWAYSKNVTLTLLDRDTLEPIPFTTFDLYKRGADNGNAEDGEWKLIDGNYLTNDSGQIRISSITMGEYRFVQTNTFNDYRYDTDITSFTVGNDTTRTEESVEVYNYLVGDIVIKLLSTDGITPLSDGEFTITGLDVPLKTDEFGQITIDNIAQGSYNITNTTPKDGYILSGDSFQNAVINQDNLSVTLVFYNEKLWDISFKKVDMGNKKPLSNAEFTLSNEFDDTVSIKKVSDENGNVVFEKMKNGNYKILETTTPDGYIVNDNEINVAVTDNGVVFNNNLTGLVVENNKIISVEGRKIWDDDNYHNRPESIVVNLKANNKEAVDINGNTVSSKTVTGDDNWEYIFANLPECDENGIITYTVVEDIIPKFENGDRYVATYSDDNYDITNIMVLEPLFSLTYTPGDGVGTNAVFGNIRANTIMRIKTPESLSFTYPGYHFVKWVAANSPLPGYLPGDNYAMPAGDVVLTAVWEKNKYTVTYEPGEGIGENITVPDIDYADNITVLGNNDTGFTKPKHRFTKWQIKGTNTYINPGDTVTIEDDITLIAIWEPVYNIIYEPGEGEGEKYTEGEYSHGESANVIDNSVTGFLRHGYVFSHWETSGHTKIKPGDTITINEDITLIAQWEKIPYKITYKSGIPNIPDYVEAPKYIGDNVTVLTNIATGFIVKDYIFTGWKSEDVDITDVGRQFAMPDKDVVFTAVWGKIENAEARGNKKIPVSNNVKGDTSNKRESPLSREQIVTHEQTTQFAQPSPDADVTLPLQRLPQTGNIGFSPVETIMNLWHRLFG